MIKEEVNIYWPKDSIWRGWLPVLEPHSYTFFGTGKCVMSNTFTYNIFLIYSLQHCSPGKLENCSCSRAFDDCDNTFNGTKRYDELFFYCKIHVSK